MAQLYPGQAYHHELAEQAIEFLQTRDPAIFPFARDFDDARLNAFVRDLREALSDITDSGSARKTSASGFIMRDRRLQMVIADWARADGDWPEDADPRDPVTELGSVESI